MTLGLNPAKEYGRGCNLVSEKASYTIANYNFTTAPLGAGNWYFVLYNFRWECDPVWASRVLVP
jgi:hypothetical protein